MSTPNTVPPAGWHPDPLGSGELRYWDGNEWTQQLRDPSTDSKKSGGTDDTTARLRSRAPLPVGSEAGFFRSMFDLSFASDRVVTVSFARLLYLLAAILSILVWLGGALLLFTIGNNTDGGFFTGWAVAQLALGWIGALVAIVLVRVQLESRIAWIRTAQHAAKLVQLGHAPINGNQR